MISDLVLFLGMIVIYGLNGWFCYRNGYKACEAKFIKSILDYELTHFKRSVPDMREILSIDLEPSRIENMYPSIDVVRIREKTIEAFKDAKIRERLAKSDLVLKFYDPIH